MSIVLAFNKNYSLNRLIINGNMFKSEFECQLPYEFEESTFVKALKMKHDTLLYCCRVDGLKGRICYVYSLAN